MNDEEKTLDALTNQTVTISLGGKSYQARRATLYDVGSMNKKRKELSEKGELANLDMDVIFHVLYLLLKDYNTQFTCGDDVAKAVPFEAYQDVMTALKDVGFNPPQTPTNAKAQVVETGAQPTQ